MSEIYAPSSIAGPAGPAGPPANFAGVYAAGTTYAAGQAVSFAPNGNSYVSLAAGNTGNQPDTSPAWWGLLASSVVPADIVAPAQMNAAIGAGIALPMSYATLGSTTATIGASNLSGAAPISFGTETQVLPGVLPQGSYVESITLHLAGSGTVPVVIGTFDGTPGPHNLFTVTSRLALDTANAVEIGPNIFQWSAPTGYAMFRVALPNTHLGIVNAATGGGQAVCGYARGSGHGSGFYEMDGDIGGVSASSTLYGPQVATDGELDASVFTRAQPPVPVSGVVPETRTLGVASVKGNNIPAGGSMTLFSATGPGNVERIQLAMTYNDGSPTAANLPANTTLTIAVDGNTYTCSLGMFLLWHGYITSDGAPATGDLFLSKYLGITCGASSGNATLAGYRRIHIPYNSGIDISITIPSVTNIVTYSQVEYYAGVAPLGRYPATRRVFHLVTNDWFASTIAPDQTITLIPPVSAAGELESLYFVSSAPGPIEPGWLEIAPSIAVDGTSFTYGGCEDFFGNQFYGDQFHGRADEYGIARYLTTGSPDNTTYWSGYRYFCESPMIFNANLSATWRNASSGDRPATRAGSLCVYYTES